MNYVFIHGAGCNAEVFAAQHAAFPGSIVLDLPGHGMAAGYADSIEDFADAVGRELARLDVRNVVLCGGSMGGAIALELALRHHPPVRGVVLVGSGAKLRVAPALLAELECDFTATAYALVHRMFAVPEAHLVKDVASMLLATGARQTIADFRACDAFDCVERLGKIAVPVLAITGARDQLTPPKYALLVTDRVLSARALILDDAGHLAMLERPHEVNAALASFLKRLALLKN